MREALRGWYGRIRSVVSGWSDLAGLGLAPLPLTVIAFLVGTLGGFLPAALVAALAISLAVNGYLVYRMRAGRQFALPSGRDSRRRDPQRHIDPLQLTTADLDRALKLAERRAGRIVGRGAQLTFLRLDLGPRVNVVFFGESERTDKAALLSVIPGDRWSIQVEETPRFPENFYSEQHLWRIDGTWRDLIRLWHTREGRPTKAYLAVSLSERSDRIFRRITARHEGKTNTDPPVRRGVSMWQLCYQLDSAASSKCLTLEEGVLVPVVWSDDK